MGLPKEDELPSLKGSHQKVAWLLIPLRVAFKWSSRGTWVTQSVECLTLDFSSGRDPRAVGSSPTLGSVLTAGRLLGILSPSVSAPPSYTLFLKIKK